MPIDLPYKKSESIHLYLSKGKLYTLYAIRIYRLGRPTSDKACHDNYLLPL